MELLTLNQLWTNWIRMPYSHPLILTGSDIAKFDYFIA